VGYITGYNQFILKLVNIIFDFSRTTGELELGRQRDFFGCDVCILAFQRKALLTMPRELW
jgi:hypothetical protein